VWLETRRDRVREGADLLLASAEVLERRELGAEQVACFLNGGGESDPVAIPNERLRRNAVFGQPNLDGRDALVGWHRVVLHLERIRSGSTERNSHRASHLVGREVLPVIGTPRRRDVVENLFEAGKVLTRKSDPHVDASGRGCNTGVNPSDGRSLSRLMQEEVMPCWLCYHQGGESKRMEDERHVCGETKPAQDEPSDATSRVGLQTHFNSSDVD
jgi:hypothetical protein